MGINSTGCRGAVLSAALLLFGLSGAAGVQAAQARDRITGPIDDSVTVTLPGNVRPEVSTATSLGAAEQDLPMQHMILTLKPDETQEAALAKLLQDQQDPHSPSYHKFLTPEQYGDQFGASANDISKLSKWLNDHGFSVEQVPAGRRSIVFSGTAGAVTSAFGTPIRKVTTAGEVHYANTDEPRIPAALSGIVGGLVKLNDFQHKPSIQRMQAVPKDAAANPQFTYGGSHYLAPADYATIYDLNSLYSNQINGTGQSIAIVARSNISMSDLETFRSQFGLPANNPTVIIASGSDPGFVEGDGDEATLDVQWSGAVAPKATVKLVVASSTASADGVDLSAQYIVNNNLAPVMSVSFGSCEAGMGSGGVAFYNSLWQQAAAEGITVLISSGDSGAAGCYSGSSASGSGRGVNGLCTSPYDVCVGGTEFAEGNNPGQYWLPGNNATMGSAQSYIPETVWNESGSNGGSDLWAGGGGASIYFTKPTWQSGVGVPADGARDVPDVALTAAGHDGYLIEEYGELYTIAGTSAASPSFAGMMALVNQKMGARLGNPNATLYQLASLQGAGGAAVFHDTTSGSNTVPGVTGFSATKGYDQASGLGSVDAAVLVDHWTDASGANTPSLAAVNNPAALSLATGASTSFVTTVTGAGTFKSAVALSVSGAPAGVTVTLSASSIASPGSGSVTATVVASKTAVVGTYTLTVTATGGNLVAKSTTTITVNSPSFTLTPSGTAVNLTAGSNASLPLSVAPSGGFNSAVALTASGLPTGVTAAFSPSTFSGTASGTSTLTFAATQAVKAGTYAVTITATGGGVTKTAALSLTVITPSFTLTSSVASATLTIGGTASVPVSIAPSGGFNSTVSLTATGLPSGVTASFAPASLAGTAGGASTLKLTAAQTAKAGNYAVTITATGGGVTRTATLTLAIPTPSFTLSSSASSATIAIDGSATASISFAPSGGFNSTVGLTASGLPAGVTASFSPASLSGSAAGTSALTLSAGLTAKAGTYAVIITATGGGLAKTFTFSLTVSAPSFTLNASTATVTVAPGGTASAPVSITPGTGFTSPVTLTAAGVPAGVTASFAPATLSGAAASTSNLTLMAGQTAKAGVYSVTLTATGGGVTKTATLSVTVTAAVTLTLTASPSSLSVPRGGMGQSVIMTYVTGPFTSAISLSASGMPAGVEASFNNTVIAAGAGNVITLTVGSSAPLGTYPITVTASGGGLIKTATVQLTVQPQPAFTLGFNNQFITVKAGGPAVPVTMSITSTTPGFNSPITLIVAGTQANITQKFSTSTLTVAAPNSTLTVSAASNATPGIYTIALAGYTNNLEQTVLLSVTVTH